MQPCQQSADSCCRCGRHEIQKQIHRRSCDILQLWLAVADKPVICHWLQVMGFSSRKEADDFMQSRHKYVLGAVHFVESPSKQLQYIIQSNTSVSVPKSDDSRQKLHGLCDEVLSVLLWPARVSCTRGYGCCKGHHE